MFEAYFAGRVLVLAPHPDDEVIACGGTLLRFRSSISHLAVVHLTSSTARLAEYEQIHRGLRVTSHHALQYENGFCAAAIRELTLDVIRIIQIERPDVLLTPHRADAHADHEAASIATLDAVQKARYWASGHGTTPHRVATVLEYEVWTPITTPAVIYDISQFFDQKIALVSEYASQIESFPYIDYIRCFNGWRGMLHLRSGYAEAFGVYSV